MDRFRVPGRAPDGEARPKHAALPRPAHGRSPLGAPADKTANARETKRARAAPAKTGGRS